MAYNDNRDILSWKRLINSIQTNDKLGVVRESIKEGGVHRIQVDQQKHISAEHHEVVVSSNDMGIIVDIYDKQSNNIDTNTYWNDDVMEESKNIKEGTWSVPETPEQVKKLTNLLKNPLDAETALDELYDVFGDDELFDDLEVMKREEPETDVRHVVISRLKDMNFIKEVRENNQSKPTKESLASETDQRLALEELVMSYWDSLPDNMQDELKTFWDAPRDTDEIKPFDESEEDEKAEHDRDVKRGLYGDDSEEDESEDEKEQHRRDVKHGLYGDDDEEDGAKAEDLVDIITHRIKQDKNLMLKLLGDEGPDSLMNAIEDVADFYSGTTEVGSSDVSAMVDAVKKNLLHVEGKQVNELEDDGSLEYGDTEEDMAKALGMSQDEFWELAERVGQDQYGSLTKDNYQDVMDHIVDNEARYKQIHVFRKAGEFDEEIA